MRSLPGEGGSVAGLAARADDEALLDRVQRAAFGYFLDHGGGELGLVPDSNRPDSPCSIAAVGMALSCYPVGVARGWTTRAEALRRTLAALRFFLGADMSGTPDATGHRGFYFHFLDMRTGRRCWKSELSSIDTAFLAAGMRTAALWFDGDDAAEREVRDTAAALCGRIDWRWMQHGDGAIAHGWKPGRGFLPWRWVGYSEALLLYAYALGAERDAATPAAYDEWLSGYRWRSIYGHAHVHAGPLFIHQYSHLWIDFRGLRDRYMAGRGIDYFENSRRATLVQREYARRNPRGFEHYGEVCWGLTASDGPGPRWIESDGRRRRLYGYAARGAPFGPDDGTVAPWASIASLPFAPDVVLPTLRHLIGLACRTGSDLRLRCSFNPTWRDDGPGDRRLGFAVALRPQRRADRADDREPPQRPAVGAQKRCPVLVRGLRRAGFRGGWLDEAAAAP